MIKLKDKLYVLRQLILFARIKGKINSLKRIFKIKYVFNTDMDILQNKILKNIENLEHSVNNYVKMLKDFNNKEKD